MRLSPSAVTAARLVIASVLVLSAVRAETGGGSEGIVSLSLGLLLLARISGLVLDRSGFEGGGAERCVAGIVVAFSVATVLVLALGSLGWLRWSYFALAVAVLAVLAERFRTGAGKPRTGTTGVAFDWRKKAPAFLALAFATASLVGAGHRWRYQPPGGVHYDDVSYHLPAAVVWMQHADLRMLRFDTGDPSTPFYPIGGEIASWLLLAPLRSDFLARWSQFPAGVGLLLLLWALARRAGGTAGAAAGAVALALTVPRFVPDGVLSAGNDLWSAFWLLAVLLFADRYGQRPNLPSAALLGLAFGGFVGVKYFSLLCLPALAGGVVWILAGRLVRAARSRWCHAATALVGALLMGGFTYLRNAVVTGNPFFPQPLRFAGRTLLPGWEEASIGNRIEQLAGVSPLGAFAERTELLGPVWALLLLASALVLPGIGGLLAWRARRDPARATRLLLALATLPGLLLLTYALLAPDLRDVRYLLSVPLLLGAALAAMTSWAPATVRGVLWSAMLLLAVRGGWPGWSTVTGAVIAAALLAGFAAAFGTGERVRAVAGAALVCGVCFVLLASFGKYQQLRQRFEGGALALGELFSGRPVAVAYFGGNRPHFYFGNRFENRLEIAPVAGAPDLRFYDFGRPPIAGLFEGNRARTWLRNLELLRVDCVVSDGGGRQARWLERPDSPFELAAEGAGFRIWRRRG